ncbi:cell wall hydrolase [Phenylobacterium sp. LjRoot219]|uniref:cell wall hydrolase n=1 Tax=Phenylobacterium sp. LjRoot219 TaxID=3342283 RepID=UPI003ECD7217
MRRPRPSEVRALTLTFPIARRAAISSLGRLATLGAALALAGSCTPGGKAYMAVDRKVTTAPSAPRAGPPVTTVDPAAAQTAEQINALRPFAVGPIRPMRPFVIKGPSGDRARALECLSQAVYYEAAREPLKGQQAVAQVVLNRVRHPAYPKSVCGVVYQGAALPTGCQFTFTCNGSLRWRPEPALWAQAQGVARRALGGFVDKEVGSATHYHAAYVAPYWAPELVKMTQVGQHIFYRWTGTWGEPPAFTGRYAGGEAVLTPAVLRGGETPAERKVTLSVAGETRTYTVADAAAPGGVRTRIQGVLQPVRRKASPEEIKRINDSLAGVEQRLDAESAGAQAQPTAANAPG